MNGQGVLVSICLVRVKREEVTPGAPLLCIRSEFTRLSVYESKKKV